MGKNKTKAAKNGKGGGASMKHQVRKKNTSSQRSYQRKKGTSVFAVAVRYPKNLSVLVCGDGDFSFSKGLVAHREGQGNLFVATSYDSEPTVCQKYPQTAKKCLQYLRSKNTTVKCGVDATDLARHFIQPSFRTIFDRIVFNFPHTGMQRVHLNRNLIRDFMKSAAPHIRGMNGQIHIALKDAPPYCHWNLAEFAQEVGLSFKGSLAFDASLFPGYRHQTTDPDAKDFDTIDCKVHVFGLTQHLHDQIMDEFPEHQIAPAELNTLRARSTTAPQHPNPQKARKKKNKRPKTVKQQSSLNGEAISLTVALKDQVEATHEAGGDFPRQKSSSSVLAADFFSHPLPGGEKKTGTRKRRKENRKNKLGPTKGENDGQKGSAVCKNSLNWTEGANKSWEKGLAQQHLTDGGQSGPRIDNKGKKKKNKRRKLNKREIDEDL